MKKVFAAASSLLTGLACLASSSAYATVVLDGEFDSWTSTIVDPSSATGTTGRLATGGNPGAMFFSSINANGDNLGFANIKEDYVNTNALSGTFTLVVDYMKIPSADSGIMGVNFVIRQGSNFWHSSDTAVVGTATWQTSPPTLITGTFTAASFAPYPGAPLTPSFAAGVPTYFGLGTYLNGATINFGAYFDNWRLENINLSPPAVVPEAGAWALMGLVGAATCLAKRL